MPCGGIVPTKNSIVAEVATQNEVCFFCGKTGAAHSCEEWDCFLHAKCAIPFLQTKEGQVIIEHGHEVYLDFSLEQKGNLEP